MKPETCAKILKTLDECYSRLGVGTFRSGMRVLTKAIDEGSKHWRQCRSREGLEALLRREPEPTPEQLESMLKIFNLLPGAIRRCEMNHADNLPHLPGGHPAKLTQEQVEQVSKDVAQLVSEEIGTKEAQRRVAAKYGVKLRTIQKVCAGDYSVSPLQTTEPT